MSPVNLMLVAANALYALPSKPTVGWLQQAMGIGMKAGASTRVVGGGVVGGGARVVRAAQRVHKGLVVAGDGVHIAPGPHGQVACAAFPQLSHEPSWRPANL